MHNGVPKLVDVCVVHAGHGVPASNVPSAITFAPPGVHVGVGDAVPVGVTVGVEVAVGVAVGVAVPVGVGVGPAGPATARINSER